MKRWHVHCGNVLDWIGTVPKESVHCVVTSPPYFGLRDYGTGRWEGGDENCGHKTGGQVPQTKHPNAKEVFATGTRPGSDHQTCRKCGAVRVDDQIGLERTPDEYAAKLVELFRGVRRALHPTGVVWLNLGDSYASKPAGCKGVSGSSRLNGVNGKSNSYRKRLEKGQGTKRDTANFPGVKPKDLLGIPWLVAFALRADGWYLRMDVVWSKGNAMPESITDRPSKAHEYVFLLTKSPRYFYDYFAVREPAVTAGADPRRKDTGKKFRDAHTGFGDGMRTRPTGPTCGSGDEFANKRSVWNINPKPFKGAHFAVMPKRLAETCIKAGSSEKGCCPHCLTPWVRVLNKVRTATRPGITTKVTGDSLVDGNRDPERHITQVKSVGWKQSCACGPTEPIPCTVCDVFAGSGTTLIVANDLKRNAVGCDLNPKYVRMAEKRLAGRPVKLF